MVVLATLAVGNVGEGEVEVTSVCLLFCKAAKFKIMFILGGRIACDCAEVDGARLVGDGEVAAEFNWPIRPNP